MTTQQAAQLPPAERRQVALRERFSGMGETDVLKAWYKAEEPFDLTPREEEIRRRWDFAKGQFLALATYSEVVDALQREFSVSIAQARNDVRNMRHAFGNLDEVPKSVHRERAIEMALATFRLAQAKEDADGMAKATKNYIAATGLDRDDSEKVDIEKLMKERIYVEALDAKARNFLLNYLKNAGGSADASKLFEEVYAGAGQGEFTDFEEVEAEE